MQTNYITALTTWALQVFACVLLHISNVQAVEADHEREQRLAEQTVSTLFIGEPIKLGKTPHEFLALISEPDSTSKGIVILLHGRGYGPDTEIVIGPLREALTDNGWQTLSLQMPVLSKGKKYYDYVELFPAARERINAAIEYIKQAKIDTMVMLAHSCGGHMAMDWIRHNGDGEIDAFIGLGLGATDYLQPMRKPFPLDKMHIPMLDIFGSEDYPAVHKNAKIRKPIISKNNPVSKQLIIPAANHEFADQNEPMIEAVLAWLQDSL